MLSGAITPEQMPRTRPRRRSLIGSRLSADPAAANVVAPSRTQTRLTPKFAGAFMDSSSVQPTAIFCIKTTRPPRLERSPRRGPRARSSSELLRRSPPEIDLANLPVGYRLTLRKRGRSPLSVTLTRLRRDHAALNALPMPTCELQAQPEREIGKELASFQLIAPTLRCRPLRA